MTNRTIPYGSSSHVMKMRFPNDWPTNATVKVTITDKAGTTLVDAADATVLAADTVASAVDAETFDIQLTTGKDYLQGDAFAVGSDAIGFHLYEVDDYTSSTNTITTLTGIEEAIPVGAAVRAIDARYAVDVSANGSGETWENATDLYVLWTPSAGTPYTEEWRILKARSDIGGLQEEFQSRYSLLYNKITTEDFDKYEEGARTWLRVYFSGHGRDLDKLVDPSYIKEPTMLRIALMIGNDKGIDGMSEAEYTRLRVEMSEQLDMLNGESLWIDSNQDGKQDEEETQPAASNFARGGILW